jgi:hypothetical protein
MSVDEDDAERIRRSVTWMYRHTIKSPPDSVKEIARDEQVTVAVVKAGIAEAIRLLDQVQPALDAGLMEFDPARGIRLVEDRFDPVTGQVKRPS